ncbi:MAG: amidohydrolase [Pseudomonadales bacterium]|jgi:predicted amidohydrolase YtcJ
MSIRIYRARRIITMNPANPEGTHIAVRDGEILGVGSLDELTVWGEHTVDERFAQDVIVPGFVEAHAHVMEGAMALMPYLGYFDRPLPDGSTAAGVKSYAELIERLKEIDGSLADPDVPIIARGFDPIYFDGERLTRKHLDQVSTTRPIFLYHASGHLATANTAMLAANDVTRDLAVEGLGRDAHGELDGELREPPAMSLCRTGYRAVMRANSDEAALWNFGAGARNAGITTVTDLGGTLTLAPEGRALWQRVVNDDRFPARVAIYNLPVVPGGSTDFAAAADAVLELKDTATDKLRFPGVKFILDGSIQGWTALLNAPGYLTGEDHGQLLTVPEQFLDWLLPFHENGVNVHMHCNGNRTQDLAIETVDAALRRHAWLDHRHTVTHAQLTTQAQLRKMANLGLCANFFANHLWYWGDQHYEQTVGPERANALEPCASALREGVPFSIHSDAGVTPLGQLHTMWCAVNRLTPKGRVLGEVERISPYEALRAVTISAAYQLHLDHEIGSLEAGKRADLAVLSEDPLSVDPLRIRDITVRGTMLGGVHYPAA